MPLTFYMTNTVANSAYSGFGNSVYDLSLTPPASGSVNITIAPQGGQTIAFVMDGLSSHNWGTVAGTKPCRLTFSTINSSINWNFTSSYGRVNSSNVMQENRLINSSAQSVNNTIMNGNAGSTAGWTANDFLLLIQLYFINTATHGGSSTITLSMGSGSYATPNISAPAAGSNIKVWNGTEWVSKPLKRWNGTEWVDATLKRYNGATWDTI